MDSARLSAAEDHVLAALHDLDRAQSLADPARQKLRAQMAASHLADALAALNPATTPPTIKPANDGGMHPIFADIFRGMGIETGRAA